MGRATSATINFTLTGYAQGHMNDLASTMELANRLAPIVPVQGGTGYYKIFSDKNSFQVYDTARAVGGDGKRIDFGASDGTFATKPQALEVTVDQDERDRAGSSDALAQQLLDEGKIKALLNAQALSHVKKVTDYVIANTTAAAGVGDWTNNDIDPIDQLDAQLDALTVDVGSAQNLMLTMSLTAWRTLRNHPKVKTRVLGAQATPITREQLVQALSIPVNLGIHAIAYNTAGLGQAVAKARLASGHAFLHYNVPSPTQYDPSPFKVFTMNSSLVAGVRTWRDLSDRFDTHALDWSEDIKQTSTLAMRRIAVTTN